MSLLSMMQDITDNLGLKRPTQIIGNSERDIRQLLAIANEEGEDLASRYHWQTLIREGTFTLAATANQGDINDSGGTIITDEDFQYIMNDSFWNRTDKLPIPGPLNAQDWQTLQNFTVTGPYLQYRIQQDQLLIDPTPSADSVGFEYVSKFWCESSGGTGQSKWTADTDVGRLDERLMKRGIRWRWLSRHGLAYDEDMRTYEHLVANAMMRDGGKTTLRLDSEANRRVPGIFLPQGSWNL